MQKSMKDEVFIILTFLEEQASVEMGFYDLLQIAGHFSFSDHKSSNLTERQFDIFQCEIRYFEKSLPDHTPNFFVCMYYVHCTGQKVQAYSSLHVYDVHSILTLFNMVYKG